jgi:hypothetical protein
MLQVEDRSEYRSTVAEPRRDWKQGRWQLAAFVVCLLFGALLVALIHASGDGGWFWYAKLFRSGKRLYSDLHLPLQPLLPLEFAFFESTVGTRWLPMQLLGFTNAVVFAVGVLVVTRYSPWSDWQRAALMVCAFVTTSDFMTFRFDDYHIMSAALCVFSVILLLLLSRTEDGKTRMALTVGLGVLSGVCCINRANDGATLLTTVVFILIVAGRWRNLLPAVVVGATALATALAGVAATGDSLHSWWRYSIAGAAAIKGGTNHVILYPFKLPWTTIKLLSTVDRRMLFGALYTVGLLVLATYVYRRRRMPDGSLDKRWAGGVLALYLVSALVQRRTFFSGGYATPAVEASVLAMFVYTIYVLIRRARVREDEVRGPAVRYRELILLIPMSQLISIAMSSGAWYPNAFPPVAMFLLLLPIALPQIFTRSTPKTVLLCVAIVLLIASFREKMREPFHWWDYQSASVFAPRVWYHHPLYGPMLIERSQLNMVEPVCKEIAAQSTAAPTLLSVPFPFANYFCGIEPWHDYVQTFYDTTSRQTIETMVHELETDPPQWIFYERELRAMRQHEVAFHEGNPLPHRDFDALVLQRVQSGQWKIVFDQKVDNDISDWLLIRTR